MAKRRKSSKRRSAAQRAATKRMLAANRARFHTNPSKRRRRRKSVVAHSRVRHIHHTRTIHRNPAKRRSAVSHGSGRMSIMSVVKLGAIGGAGALLTDVTMGLISNITAPAAGSTTPGMLSSVTSPVNTDGSTNLLYYAAKLGLAYSIGRFGSRFTRQAHALAMGGVTVTLYQLMRAYIPAGTVPLGRGVGYLNPARIVSGGVGRILPLGKRLPAGVPARPAMGRILSVPNVNTQPGASAAAALRMGHR